MQGYIVISVSLLVLLLIFYALLYFIAKSPVSYAHLALQILLTWSG